MVNIEGLDKAEVLATLYNNANIQGMGMFQALLHNTVGKNMTIEEAKELLDATPDKYFDYVIGRVMKVDLSSDTEFNERLYDRDNGEGAAERAIATIRIKSADTVVAYTVENKCYDD